ncbi:MFS transporter [Dactylosporangium matsuzakiense]|uniref:MFS transporter n=1 Tax=Dactylosporangium matsuzakiense TaxID=53360 RepID=A0A9W6KXP0_9ACTN|nr:MFS transporter [Dactylosporangium matsuzakiense]UWZ41701.1 MFS transporter [Dactylosporangium matsuzakiense]GLL07359.1 MFS transporter [Dactylosporangium matsuzakiense]
MTTVIDRPAAAGKTERRRLSHEQGFWAVAFAFAVSLAFTVVPTPLWAIYQRHDGYSTIAVTIAFAAYAFGVILSLFLAGHVSDWLGRRRILLPAVLLEALSAVLFLTSTGFGVVIVARVLSGLGIGMITATATAHLSELHAKARPDASRARGDLVATVANLGGFAFGPVVSGLLAQYVGAPLRTPYLVFLGLLLVAALAVALAPETVAATARRYRPQRVGVPAAARPRYFAAATGAFASLSVLGLFTSLAPAFVAGTLHHPSRALAGAVASLVFGSGAVAQVLLRRRSIRAQLGTGLLLIVLGLATVTAAVWAASLTTFLLGGVLAGAGAGALLKGGISTVVDLAPAGIRGEALAGLFLGGYLGLAVPVLGLGVLTQVVSAPVALLGFAGAIAALVALVSRPLLRR